MTAKGTAIGLLAAMACCAVGAAPTGYTLVDLGADTQPWAINDDGTVVGCMKVPRLCEPAVYQDGSWQLLKDSQVGQANAIDRGGIVVGNDGNHAVMWNDGHRRALLGSLRRAATAEGISNNRIVVGTRYVAQHTTGCYAWKAGQVTDLGTLDGGNCSAHAIDKTGRYIVGESRYSGFIYDETGMHDLGRVKGDGLGTWARAVNSHGHVSASSQYDNSGDWAAAFWNGRKLVRVPGAMTPNGVSYGGAINDNDEMLVAGQDEANHFLFLYDGRTGVTTAIEPLIHNSEGWSFGGWLGVQSALVAGLSDQGTIVGTASVGNVPHGYMLVPDGQ